MDADKFDALAQSSQSAQRSSRRSNRRSSVASSLNPNVQLLKLSFELSIRKLSMRDAPDQVKFQVLWVRGGKKIDTRTKLCQDGQVKIGDKFQMKTSLELDTVTNTFV